MQDACSSTKIDRFFGMELRSLQNYSPEWTLHSAGICRYWHRLTAGAAPGVVAPDEIPIHILVRYLPLPGLAVCVGLGVALGE